MPRKLTSLVGRKYISRPYARLLRLKQKVPIKLSKYYLGKVINKVTEVKSVKKKHSLIEEYGKSGENTLHICMEPSLEQLIPYYSSLSVYACSSANLLTQLRKAILSHNWNYLLKLLLLLVQSKQLNRRHFILLIRSSLILLLNHEDSSTQLVHEFLSLLLGIQDNQMISFLESIFVLPNRLLLGPRLENRLHARKSSREQKQTQNSNRKLKRTKVCDGKKSKKVSRKS